mgnify:CR=1 FL=1
MILACQNISKSFGVEPVIRNVSFHVEDQEKVAIVGINGAGKSTLLKIIVGELPADEGTVTLAKERHWGIWHSIRIWMMHGQSMRQYWKENASSLIWSRKSVNWKRNAVCIKRRDGILYGELP